MRGVPAGRGVSASRPNLVPDLAIQALAECLELRRRSAENVRGKRAVLQDLVVGVGAAVRVELEAGQILEPQVPVAVDLRVLEPALQVGALRGEGPEQIDRLVGAVEAAIYEDGEREVPTRRIGELVFNALRDLDKVAFVRFASVYREFQDVHDFVEELQPILDGRRRDPRS